MPRFTFVQLLELTPENRLSFCRLQSSIAGATGGYMPCLTAPQQRVGEGEGKKKAVLSHRLYQKLWETK